MPPFLFSLRFVGSVVAVVYLAIIIVALTADRPDLEDGPLVNKLTNPPGMADRLIMLDSAEEWQAGQMKFLRADANRIALSGGGDRDYPRRGIWTSPEFSLDMPATEIIPSWNGLLPANTG